MFAKIRQLALHEIIWANLAYNNVINVFYIIPEYLMHVYTDILAIFIFQMATWSIWITQFVIIYITFIYYERRSHVVPQMQWKYLVFILNGRVTTWFHGIPDNIANLLKFIVFVHLRDSWYWYEKLQCYWVVSTLIKDS